MTPLAIQIVRDGDPPPWADLPDKVKDGTIERLGILEKGTVEGRPTVAVVVQAPDGERMFGRTTLANFIAALAAARGAFPEAFRGGAFDPRDADEMGADLIAAVDRIRSGLDPVEVTLTGPPYLVLQARVTEALALLDKVVPGNAPAGIHDAMAILRGDDA